MNAVPPTRAPSSPESWSGRAPRTRSGHARSGAVLALLAAGLVLLGLLFHEEIAAAIATWVDSTVYNHGWLVLPVALWLAWQRRDRLAALAPSPDPRIALLALPLALAWLAAERADIMEARQFAALFLAETLIVALLGPAIARALRAPLAYCVFLVPFGAFATPWLQEATLWIITKGLSLLGIPHYVDALTIETPAGTFLVAEACAGLRFLVAALAFGALYAATMFRTPWRRAAVIALALAVPVLANGLRALGIVLLAQHLGSAAAAAADHLIYGWVFFAIVILLLILAGLPFREDAPVPRPAPRRAAAAPGAALLAAALVLAPPAAAALVTVERAAREVVLTSSGPRLSARLLVFAPGAGPAALRRAERWLSAGFASATTDAPWRIYRSADGTTLAGFATWRGGAPSGEGLRARLRWAADTMSAGPPAVLAFATWRADAAPAERDALLAAAAAEAGSLSLRE